jgi:hypothetical protein
MAINLIYSNQLSHCFDIKLKLPGWDDAVVSATQRYIAALQEVAWARVFFITKYGYIGLGPLSTFVGDDVAIFYGEKTPYILLSRSRKSATFHLIGEAYIHGLIEGEALQEDAQAKIINLV